MHRFFFHLFSFVLFFLYSIYFNYFVFFSFTHQSFGFWTHSFMSDLLLFLFPTFIFSLLFMLVYLTFSYNLISISFFSLRSNFFAVLFKHHFPLLSTTGPFLPAFYLSPLLLLSLFYSPTILSLFWFVPLFHQLLLPGPFNSIFLFFFFPLFSLSLIYPPLLLPLYHSPFTLSSLFWFFFLSLSFSPLSTYLSFQFFP